MDFVSDSRAQTVPRSLLAGLRVYLGIVFLVAVWGKLTADPSWTPRLQATLDRAASGNATAFYKAFLDSVVRPNVGLFAGLIQLGELFAGLALLTGTATRLAAGVAMFLTLNYMLMKGAWLWTPSSNDAAMTFIGLALLLGAAGRAFGMDYFLARRYPGVRFW